MQRSSIRHTLRVHKKHVVIIAVAVAVVMGAAAVGVAENTFVVAKPDEAVLAYSGGQFVAVIQPSAGRTWPGLFSTTYTYPVTQRDYIVSRSGDGDRKNADFIAAPNADGVQVEWELAVYFKLNVSRLRSFHENVGLRYHAWLPQGTASSTDDNLAGWRSMLNNVFRQQIEGAVQRVSRAHPTDDFARNSEVYGMLASEIAAGLKNQVNDVVGDAYFCGPAFSGRVAENDTTAACPDFNVVVKAVTLPENVRQSYAAQKQAQIDVVTARDKGDADIEAAKKRAEADVAEAEGKRKSQEALQGLYNDPAYIEYLKALAQQQCASSQSCTLVVTDGAPVNVATGR